MTQHPELKPYQKITQEQQIKSNQDIAGVLRHLFMEACTKELKAAMKYESSNYLQSFEVFGRTAMVNILSDPSVQKEINAVGEYFGDMDLSSDD